VLLYVTEVQDNPERNADFLDKVKRISNSASGLTVQRSNSGAVQQRATPAVFVVINKIDLTTQDTLERLVEFWHAQLPEARIFPISAQERFGVSQLFDAIREALPDGPPFFPKDQLTDKPARFFVNEIIREKILLQYDKEIPYSVEVEVESFIDHSEAPTTNDKRQTTQNLIEISAVIYCERESQKGIIIGRAGSALKRVGSLARKDIEEFFQKPVFLQLFVKVDRDWRSNQGRLRHYGYDLT